MPMLTLCASRYLRFCCMTRCSATAHVNPAAADCSLRSCNRRQKCRQLQGKCSPYMINLCSSYGNEARKLERRLEAHLDAARVSYITFVVELESKHMPSHCKRHN